MIAAIACVLLIDAGAHRAAAATAPKPIALKEFTGAVTLRGESLKLHFAVPSTSVPASTPLVLYASGDGGWFGAAVGMFHTLARSGYPVVGISSKAFMHIEQQKRGPLAVSDIVAGYQQIIDAARVSLQLPIDGPVVLTGWSRGAALGTLVASSHEVDPHVIGLVAIGLAADERLDIDGGSDDDAVVAPAVTPSDHRNSRAHVIEMYPLLARIVGRRAVVIQATRDGYLPAARARDLFGPDSANRRFVAIEARNHRFDDGEAAFATALAEALNWISGREETSK